MFCFFFLLFEEEEYCGIAGGDGNLSYAENISFTENVTQGNLMRLDVDRFIGVFFT